MRNLLFILFLVITASLSAQTVIVNPYEGVDFTDSVFKSNLQMHTIESDGDQTVAERLIGGTAGTPAGYADSAYTILSITDHDSYESGTTPEFSGPHPTFPPSRYSGMSGYVPSETYIWATDTSSQYYPTMGDGVLYLRGNELTECGTDGGQYSHVLSYFTHAGFADCPTNGWADYFDTIKYYKGGAIFAHIARHTGNAAHYNGYFDTYTGYVDVATYYAPVIWGVEIATSGDYQPEQDPRALWDAINASRSYNDLRWGFSDSDIHNSGWQSASNDAWKNYNHHYLSARTELAFRRSMVQGALTSSIAGHSTQVAPIGDNTYHATPRLEGVSISGTTITITASDADSILWWDDSHTIVSISSSIDVNNYTGTSNFLRAELRKEGWSTFLQPFGIASQTTDVLEDSTQVTTYSRFGYGDGEGPGLVPDYTNPTRWTVSKNYMSFTGDGGHAISGLDLPDEYMRNLDGSEYSANRFDWHSTGDGISGIHGIMAGYHVDLDIKHNYLDSVGYGIVVEGQAGMKYNKNGIQNNIFRHGQYAQVLNQGMSGLRIYNNTFYNDDDMLPHLIQITTQSQTVPSSPANSNIIKNNIFYQTTDIPMINVDSESSATFECDYNVYYVEAGDHEPSFIVAGVTTTWDEWQALGFDANSVVVDPNFVDVETLTPTTALEYGINLGADYDAQLASDYTFSVGVYPDTVQQSGTWEVGAVSASSDAPETFPVDTTNIFVDTTTNAVQDGSWSYPFNDFQDAIEAADAGDTVYIKGGTYRPSSYTNGSDIYYWSPGSGHGNSGTEGNLISFLSYPGEAPIIDFSLVTPPGSANVGIQIEAVHYFTFKGITFQNLQQSVSPGPDVHCMNMAVCSNWKFEECVFQDNGGAAIRSFSGIGAEYGILTDSCYLINCDFFRNVDVSGEHGDGVKMDSDKGAYLYINGCRAGFNADDGFDISGSWTRVVDDNWAFCQGWETGGNGNGFKIGAVRDTMDYVPIIFTNNLSALNHNPTTNSGAGLYIPDYQVSDSSYRRANARIIGNTVYNNDMGFREEDNVLWAFRNCEYRNNIAYDSRFIQDQVVQDIGIITYGYPESNNTWKWVSGGYSFEPNIIIDDSDFVLTDSAQGVAQMMAPRKADGSLPDITFMTLAAESALIDAGTTTGYSEISSVPGVPAQGINGAAPDIGYAEYGEASPTPSTGRKAGVGSNGKILVVNGKIGYVEE